MAWRLLDVEWPDKPYYNLAVEEAVALAVEADAFVRYYVEQVSGFRPNA